MGYINKCFMGYINKRVLNKTSIYRSIKLRYKYLMDKYNSLEKDDISNIIYGIISEYDCGSNFDYNNACINILKNISNIDNDTVYDILVFMTKFTCVKYNDNDNYLEYYDYYKIFSLLYINNIIISYDVLDKFMAYLNRNGYCISLSRLINLCFGYTVNWDRHFYLRDNYIKKKINIIIDMGSLDEKIEVLKASNLPYDIKKSVFDSIIKNYSVKEKLSFLSYLLRNYTMDVTYLIDLYVKEGIIDNIYSVIDHNIRNKDYSKTDIVNYVKFLVYSDKINNSNIDNVLDRTGLRSVLVSYYDVIDKYIFDYIDPDNMIDIYNRAIYLKSTLFGDNINFSGKLKV